MLDKQQIRLRYSQGISYAQMARDYSVSRQRIHQIVKKYTHFGRDGRKRFYKDIGKCNTCDNLAEILHHKDLNNSNDSKINLEPLCKICHVLRHKNSIKIIIEGRKRICTHCEYVWQARTINPKACPRCKQYFAIV